MGSEGKMNKPHYNISMSRRTRKPVNLKIERESSDERERERKIQHQKSLKQLIEGRCSLAEHFRSEEEDHHHRHHHHHVALRHFDQDGFDGVKFKRMVRDYARVFLNRLIKVN